MLSPQSQNRSSPHPSLKSLSSPSATGNRAEVTKSLMEKTWEPKRIYKLFIVAWPLKSQEKTWGTATSVGRTYQTYHRVKSRSCWMKKQLPTYSPSVLFLVHSLALWSQPSLSTTDKTVSSKLHKKFQKMSFFSFLILSPEDFCSMTPLFHILCVQWK